ncbi:EI24 domain-containing protein [Tenacibaculum finnmarkense]|uniref:EI24 domain-containing protein n=1 Tax=Tenacibaculum finnmarkense TaxID=2781243 RepID=UPI001EFA752A|nr:EI24 domain-containing protein [Tenacibaculum finnmarkense]MCG8206396.1 EI24 domain-containing protein [Tenacibaculum finnmarkense genomovar finnmarkense]MCG8722440.1 EI24 domain-containing protein [Tenacibaculum finnmarkense]MCG8740764.1 EI24 domain-containing protein [Tenacibaculum finnmarkense]MCG8764176.1 EI24 domain-containing protein [Tenacibaculum finnmarkense]MCG8777030.1 EI24 domain-containing protein [Tenacibaculum finnmarkense]
MIKNILQAIKAYFGAFQLISKLKLWNYFIIPILISVFTAIIIASSAYALSDDVGHYIANFWKWDFGKKTFEVISTFLSGLSILLIGLILYKHIVMALSAPFMSPVSEKIEAYLTGGNHSHRKTSFQEQLIRGIRINTRNLLRELLVTIPVLLLSLIPVIGLFSTALLFLIQAYYAGFGNMDYTLERHFKYKESVEFVKENKGTAVGNGLVFILFLLVPFIGVLLVLPLSVTAATTETIKKIQLKKVSE